MINIYDIESFETDQVESNNNIYIGREKLHKNNQSSDHTPTISTEGVSRKSSPTRVPHDVNLTLPSLLSVCRSS